jgi:hypothetical protein
LIDRDASLLFHFSLASRFDGFTNIDEAPRKGIATGERFVLSTNRQYTARGIKNHAICSASLFRRRSARLRQARHRPQFQDNGLTLDFRVAQQELNCSKISRFLIEIGAYRNWRISDAEEVAGRAYGASAN